MKTFKPILKVFTLLILISSSRRGVSQNVGFSSSSGFTPDASAALDVSYTNKGLLVPRVALTASNVASPVASPATSLLIYNTATAGTSPNNVVPGYYYWNGSVWTALLSGAQIASLGWSLTGNTATTAGTNFLGTTDATDLVIKTTNTERARIVGAGTTPGSFIVSGNGTANLSSANPERLLVDAGPTSSFNVISGKGSLNNYLQLNIQNSSSGTGASSDVVASNDAASETANFIDMGINSSTNNSSGPVGGASTAYLYSAGNDFAIGNGTASKNLTFFTSGTTVTVPQTYTERMRIDPSGNVGIGTASPATKLHVFGANPLALSGVVLGTSTSADSILTITSGLVRKLPVSAFAATGNAWSVTGNSGTTAGTNFIGTTDAADLVFKANNIERFRIVNTVSSVTGTAGDITIGDATSGTLKSAKELLLRQDGDVFGPSALRLRNRTGENGAIFETLGASANLVDFIFKTGTTAAPISSNIRFETRSASLKMSTNTTEWQFGKPDATNGGPTLVIGAAGTGSNSSFLIGNVGIGTASPAYKLTVAGVVAPSVDNTYSLGGGTTNRWSALYCTNGVIQTSDRRLKTNISNLNYGLKEVLALQPVSYNWKDKNQPQNKVGLIAQDVKKIIPEVVIGDENKETLGINYADLVPVLINAIKQQQVEVQNHQKEITDLKKIVQNLQKQL